MIKNKKVYKVLFCMIILLILSGCEFETSRAITFDIETGDKIEVKLDTTDGYALSQEDGKFFVKKKEEEILQGVFMTNEKYDIYLENVHISKDVRINEEGKKGEHDYLAFEIGDGNHLEQGILLKVKNTQTNILLASTSMKEEALQAFQYLSFAAE